MLSVDYFKSFKTQIRNSTVVGAKVQDYANGTLRVSVEFEANGRFFRGVIEPNITTFIFQ